MWKKFIVSWCCLLSFYSFGEKIAVGWELWYPYQYRSSEQQLVGLDFEVVNAIFKQAGFEADYTELPWKRHLLYIKTGDIDLAMGSSFTEERQEFAYFTKPYRKETVKLFGRTGQTQSIILNRLDELTNSSYMIGVEGGYYYGHEYQLLIKSMDFREHISEVIDIEENVKMLLKGHIDGFLVDPVTMKAFAEKYKMTEEFEAHPINIYQSDIHIMLSKKSTTPDMLKRLNQAIEQLKNSGKIDEIIRKWSELN